MIRNADLDTELAAQIRETDPFQWKRPELAAEMHRFNQEWHPGVSWVSAYVTRSVREGGKHDDQCA